ncbi:MAG: SMC-Scp complex subunit ScpB [Planctomycetota bacterium]
MIGVPGKGAGGEPALEARLEALLFVAREALPVRKLADCLGAPAAQVRRALAALGAHYEGCGRGIHLREVGGGWRLLTNPGCAAVVEALQGRRERERLSPAALETLAIVAYKQPVSRAEIERIRGVAVSPLLHQLLELDLIRVCGREEGIGRALLYGTTRSFLDRFGLKDAKDLPASM